MFVFLFVQLKQMLPAQAAGVAVIGTTLFVLLQDVVLVVIEGVVVTVQYHVVQMLNAQVFMQDPV